MCPLPMLLVQAAGSISRPMPEVVLLLEAAGFRHLERWGQPKEVELWVWVAAPLNSPWPLRLDRLSRSPTPDG